MLAIRSADFDRRDLSGGPPCARRWANSLSRDADDGDVAAVVARMRARQAMHDRQADHDDET